MRRWPPKRATASPPTAPGSSRRRAASAWRASPAERRSRAATRGAAHRAVSSPRRGADGNARALCAAARAGPLGRLDTGGDRRVGAERRPAGGARRRAGGGVGGGAARRAAALRGAGAALDAPVHRGAESRRAPPRHSERRDVPARAGAAARARLRVRRRSRRAARAARRPHPARDRPSHGACARRSYPVPRQPGARPHVAGDAAMNEILRDRLQRKLEALPEDKAYLVLDYVEFLESKYAERPAGAAPFQRVGLVLRSEEHTSELQSPDHLVCRLLLE